MEEGFVRSELGKGFHCAQIILREALRARGEENEALVRAMTGLGNGIGGSGNVCGALTGAVCMLSLYAGYATEAEEPDYRLNEMTEELLSWFEETYDALECEEITDNSASKKTIVCPALTARTYDKALELLTDYGYRLPDED